MFCLCCRLGFTRYFYRSTPFSFLSPTGCQLIVENSLVKDTLSLVQNEVRDLIKDYQSMESKLKEVSENGSEEFKNVLETLLSIEEKLSMRLQVVEEGLADTNDRVEQLEQRCDKSDDKMGQIEDKLTKLGEETSKSGKLR